MPEVVGIILQARLGSSRLPSKVLLPFGDTCLLGWIIRRLSKLPWKLVVATSALAQDNGIADYCIQQSVTCFRGSEKDVLDRYYQCAKTHGFDHIVRLTGDNPFPDTEELSRLISFHLEKGYDYTHNIGQLPIGTGTEIFSIASLDASWREGQAPQHREHVNEYILENPEKFTIGRLSTPSTKNAPTLSLTIDTPADYQRITLLHHTLGYAECSTEELIATCSSSA